MEYSLIVASILHRTLKSLDPSLEFSLEDLTKLLAVPKDSSHGDIAFPCFTLAKQLRSAPPKIAQDLLALLKQDQGSEIEKIEAVGAYLNFFLNKANVAAVLLPDILAGNFLRPRERQSDRVMLEYSQPNTHKAFHVGHVRCASLGDSLIRVFEWCGHEVVAANYLGDEGTHVAKCLWYLTKHFKGEVPEKNRGEFLGNLYTLANDLVSLSLLTRVPYPGVVAARVLDVQPHSENKEWSILKLDIGSQQVIVLTAARGVEVGQLVPYAAPGTRVSGRSVGTIEKGGVTSTGMVCAFNEIGLGSDSEHLPVLDSEISPGTELANLYAIEGSVPKGVSVLEEFKRRSDEIGAVLLKLESGDPEMKELWQKTKDWSMQEFYAVYKWLDCRFDHYFFESEEGESGKELAREFQKKGIFIEDHGAIGADLKSAGLGFCILIKSNGTATYAARDLSLARKKFETYKIDRSLYIVDAAQTLHFNQVFKCLELMGYEQARKCQHLPYAQVIRPDGKMSSRKGNVILFSQLQELLLEKIDSDFLSKYRGDWSDSEIAHAAQAIALATVRYGMLNQDNNSQIIFDLDEWAAKTGNTGPYLMYAFSRIRSILRELGQLDSASIDWGLLKHETEVEVLMHLKDFPAVVLRAKENLSPLLICTYAYELAKKFNRMYKQCSVIRAETEELKIARAKLIEACSMVLQKALYLLGIPTLERM